mgnify:CR=1 FL=1
MTRILYLTAESWPTHRVDVTTLFGRELPKLGVRSDLITTTTEDAPAPWGGGAVDLAVIRGGMARQYLGAFWHALTALLRADWKAYDAIQVRDLPLPAALALTLCKVRGKRFVYWMSYPMPEGQIQLAAERGMDAGFVRFIFPWVRGRIGRFLLYRYVLPRADHIFVQSEFMKNDLLAKNITAAKMTAVPMGVDTECIAPGPVPDAVRAQLEGRRVLLYLGQLDRTRRIEVLFDALALVRERDPSAVLLVVGDTDDLSQHARLQRLAQQAGVQDHVIWTGWVPIDEAWGYVALSDIGLSPIPRGPLLDCSSPTKIVEYLALGLVTVCNDNPDQAAIMAATGAGRCVPYEPEAFAKAVLALLEAPEQDKARLAEAGQAWVRENRAYERIAHMVAAAYAKICESPRPLPASEAS